MSVATLLLLRHATAESARPGHLDRDRRLTVRGQEEAHGVGEYLRGQALVVDHVLCSPAVRTRETLDALALPTGPRTPRVEHPPQLYLAGVPELLELLSLVDATTVLVVGHSPTVPAAVQELADPTTSAPDAMEVVSYRFPPATLARLTLAAGSLGTESATLTGVRLPTGSDGHHFG